MDWQVKHGPENVAERDKRFVYRSKMRKNSLMKMGILKEDKKHASKKVKHELWIKLQILFLIRELLVQEEKSNYSQSQQAIQHSLVHSL